MTNPYESPQTSDSDRSASTTPLLTRKRVFWFGLASIAAALLMISGRQVLIAEPRGVDGVWNTLHFVSDWIATIAFIAGIGSLAVYHWFPDSRRKYSWRRKQTRRTVESDSQTKSER